RGVRRVLADPYALDPDRGDRGPDQPDQWGVRWDADIRRWTGPFPMAGINTRVVRRSNALLGYPWGRDFRYGEAISFSSGPRGLLAATAVSAGFGALVGALTVAPLRKLVARTALPKPGAGPSREARERGHFTTRFVGLLDRGDGSSSPRISATVRGTSDP